METNLKVFGDIINVALGSIVKMLWLDLDKGYVHQLWVVQTPTQLTFNWSNTVIETI